MAEVAKFSWSPVDDDRVGKYVLAWGTSSAANGGVYGKGKVEVAAPAVTAQTPDLAKGQYYFAVKACTADGTLCSGWSNEVPLTVAGPIAVPPGLILESLTFSVLP